ncbi:MAG: hypothetical protein JNK10_13725, partial [Cyclobacteriaceae bacterium]|nr:hypothetical protein [Cyclobacteriaceae bacterium]
MKKIISLLAMTSIAALLMMCSEDKIEPAGLVAIDPTSGSGKPGEVVTINLSFTAPNGTKDLFVYENGEESDLIALAGATTTTYDYTIPGDAIIGSSITLTFQLVDAKGYPSLLTNCIVTVGEV